MNSNAQTKRPLSLCLALRFLEFQQLEGRQGSLAAWTRHVVGWGVLAG